MEQMEVFEIETEKPKREKPQKTNIKLTIFFIILLSLWTIVIYLLVNIILNISYINKTKLNIESNQKELEQLNIQYDKLSKEKSSIESVINDYNTKLSTLRFQNERIQREIDSLILENKNLASQL